METNIIDSYAFHVKAPIDCSEIEINNFHKLVLKGGKVSPVNLLKRVRNCEKSAYCYHEKQLVGISSIKKPSEDYVKNIIEKTGLDREWTELKFEIGYSFTEETFRNKGISKALKLNLIKAMKSGSGILFSTTAISSSKNFFQASGFEQKGNSYDGENDNGIMYYEITI